ncbi:hypothetical protein M9Y10_025810 [Tritrichomonas musculus]|uniref:Uncharacterized protein n=1 Tax=Tritrichomonas musculus TaxID=1915356 RepID=A0ABR2H9R9_9EUKA
MSLSGNLEKMKQIQSALLEYIKGDDDKSNYKKFLKLFEVFQFIKNKYDFKPILLLIKRISNDMHRLPLFFDKIFQILNYFKKILFKVFQIVKYSTYLKVINGLFSFLLIIKF